jgi:hypothetical protein
MNTGDIIYKTIDNYYRTNSGVGTETVTEIARELKSLHNIDLDPHIISKRIKEYLGDRFSGR